MPRFSLILFTLALFAASYAGSSLVGSPRRDLQQTEIGPNGCQRIVSIAPSITETLYALGLGDRLVADTTYCNYPPDAQSKPKIGDYFRPNYEAIVGVRPDLVLVLEEDREARKMLPRLGIRVVSVNQTSLDGIMQSYTTIGKLCRVEQRASTLRQQMEQRVEKIRNQNGQTNISVMLCIGRTLSGDSLKKVCIAGQDGFYSEMIKIAGGKNVYEDPMIKFPIISVEGMLTLDPDVIIDVAPFADEAREAQILQEWQSLKEVRAVREHQVYVLTGEHMIRPGPRSIDALEDIAGVLQSVRSKRAE